MAAPSAADSDLQKVRPDILTHGVASWSDQLGFAGADVLNLMKSSWWVNAVARHFNREIVDIMGSLTPIMDVTKINDSELVNLVCYRALARYVYPAISIDKDADGDAFSRRMTRYEEAYEEEWERVSLLPLYDFNSDGQFTDIERRGPVRRRVARG